MYESEKILSFIGARAGSKGLKNKNIVNLGGKPLISWSIEASLNSKYIDRTIVSTDGEHIAEVAKQAGADVPFLRPEEMAQDESLLDGAMEHCVQWLKDNEHEEYDYLLLLQPTSPLRTEEHIDEAIENYFNQRSTSEDIMISVVTAQQKSGWLMRPNETGYIEYCFDRSKSNSRRQNLPKFYLPNGAIYFGPTKRMTQLSQNNSFIIPYVMKHDVSIDIDSKADLEAALRKLDVQSQKGIVV